MIYKLENLLLGSRQIYADLQSVAVPHPMPLSSHPYGSGDTLGHHGPHAGTPRFSARSRGSAS